MPRGADAVVMIEHTELIEMARPRSNCAAPPRPGSSSPMPAPTSRAARRCCGAARRSSARARSACWRPAGLPQVDVVRRPKVAVLSTGDELVALGAAAAARRASTTATARSSPPRSPKPAASRSRSARFPTTRRRSKHAVRAALAECDMVVLSGGTSKGAGDLSHRVVSRLGTPGVLVHGVALKPGKPLCLAVVDGKPIVVLPGFPTSAIFTFHAFVAPVIRARAGLPPEAARDGRRARCRCASPPSSAARNSCWSRWSRATTAPVAFPIGQGLRLGHELLAGRRLSRDRRAAPARSMPARRRRSR